MIAINHTYTMWDCGPHTHCADRTPHSKLKKVHTRTVNHTVLLTNKKLKKKYSLELIFTKFEIFGFLRSRCSADVSAGAVIHTPPKFSAGASADHTPK